MVILDLLARANARYCGVSLREWMLVHCTEEQIHSFWTVLKWVARMQDIMEYDSTPYVGMAQEKIGHRL